MNTFFFVNDSCYSTLIFMFGGLCAELMRGGLQRLRRRLTADAETAIFSPQATDSRRRHRYEA